MSEILEDIKLSNIHAHNLFNNVNHWEVYYQDHPTDSLMLVNKPRKIGICFDDIFGFTEFPLPATDEILTRCGWGYIGDL